MKRIFSSTLLCTLLLNSFVSGVYAAETLPKTAQTSEAATIDSTSKSMIQSTSTTDTASEAATSETSTSTSESSSDTIATSSSTNSSQTDSTTTQSEPTDVSSEETTSTTKTKSDQTDPKEDASIAQQGTNHKKGTYAMMATGNARMARSIGIDSVYADDPNLPKKDFIDVSSWNGTISVAEYQKIKSYGVTGVSVKLTEGTSYINPYAQTQINNAKAAGLSVSAYHYSLYTSVQTAQAEAKYFAQAASKLGLSKNTIMFNDAEDPTLINNGRNAQANSLAFNKQLKSLGFSNDALYVGRYWIDNAYVNPASFGKERVWVAQYPYTPNKTMQWNKDYGAWQWSSLMYFPGLANYQTRAFDISMSYSSFFNASDNGPDLSNYYTTNPGKVILKRDDCFYNDVAFNSPGMIVKANTLVTVKSIQNTASGIPRLVTDQGYLTANKASVVAAQSNIDSYFTTNPKKVRLKTDDYFYADTAFTQRLNKVNKGTIVEVESLAYTDSGIFRLKTKSGYLTANKSLVEQYRDISDMYYTTNPGQIITKRNDKFYSDVEFTKAGEAVSAGTVLKVKGIEKTKNGIPRLKTEKGYYTANKDYVIATTASIDNYYTKNPVQVVLKTNDSYYRDTEFLHKGNAIAKGTLISVTGVVYRENDVPRLITPDGYLTANKNYVQEVPSNITNYYYSNPGYVVMKKNDTYYNDINFSQKGNAVDKNELIKVQDVVFTSGGLPRLKTEKGYLTANKSYVTKLVNDSENYFTENPRKIIMLRGDRYYSDIDFQKPGTSIPKGTTINILGIEYTANGVPRLKTEKGYVTANKGYVTAAANGNGQYFVTNPKKVKFLVNDCYYKDINFKQKSKAISKGTVLSIEAIEYTSNGLPRLKTANGYITANKAYVQKVD